MATAQIIVIPDRYTCRGLNFMPNGQQYSGAVPPGEYDVIEGVDVCYTDLGKPARTTATMLVNIANGEKWYVSANVGQFLLSEHKRT